MSDLGEDELQEMGMMNAVQIGAAALGLVLGLVAGCAYYSAENSHQQPQRGNNVQSQATFNIHSSQKTKKTDSCALKYYDPYAPTNVPKPEPCAPR